MLKTFENELNPVQNKAYFHGNETFENNMGKGENASKQQHSVWSGQKFCL